MMYFSGIPHFPEAVHCSSFIILRTSFFSNLKSRLFYEKFTVVGFLLKEEYCMIASLK